MRPKRLRGHGPEAAASRARPTWRVIDRPGTAKVTRAGRVVLPPHRMHSVAAIRAASSAGKPNAPVLMATGVTMLMLSPLWQVFDATSMAYAEGLRAAGDTTFTMWARAGLAWLVFVPGSYISVRYFGQGNVAVMLWVTTYIALLAVVLVFRFRSGVWRRIALTENI